MNIKKLFVSILTILLLCTASISIATLTITINNDNLPKKFITKGLVIEGRAITDVIQQAPPKITKKCKIPEPGNFILCYYAGSNDFLTMRIGPLTYTFDNYIVGPDGKTMLLSSILRNDTSITINLGIDSIGKFYSQLIIDK